MSLDSRLERLERAGLGESRHEVVRIAADAGGGYVIDVEVPADALAQLAKAYGEGADGEPTLQS